MASWQLGFTFLPAAVSRSFAQHTRSFAFVAASLIFLVLLLDVAFSFSSLLVSLSVFASVIVIMYTCTIINPTPRKSTSWTRFISHTHLSTLPPFLVF